MSSFIRAARHLGYSLPRLLRELLHVDLKYTNFTAPFSVPDASALTKLSCGELLSGHTFFPYVTAFLSSATTKAIAENCLENSSIATTHFTFMGGSVANRFDLHFCAKCKEDDLRQYGETYWHRKHMLPGVFVCTLHDIPLLSTGLPAGYVEVRSCDYLPADVVGTPVTLPTRRELIAEVATTSEAMLNGASMTVETQISRYQHLLDIFGGEPEFPRAFEHPTYVGLRAFYGTRYLDETNFVWLRGQTIVRNRARQNPNLPTAFGFNTHKHILLNIFLDHLLARGPDLADY